MKTSKSNRKIVTGLFVALFLCLSIPVTALGQTEKLGIVSYTSPKGWKKTAKANIVSYSETDEAAGKFAVITLYGATGGTGSPQGDFKREWNDLVVEPLKGEINPKTEVESADGWTVTAGAASVEFLGGKSMAFLTVYSGFGKTVSLLGILNDEAYLPNLVAFSSGINIEKGIAKVSPVPAEEPLPRAAAAQAMHAGSLVTEFETNEIRAHQMWVGKRVRINGVVNSIDVKKDGKIVLTFKSTASAYGNARCYFNKSQSSRVAALSAHEEATVEGIVRGWEDGYDGAKVFVLLEDCIVP